MSNSSKLSDNAIRFWMAYFFSPKSTLSFGGDHAEMEITPMAREALNELLEFGAVKPIPPTDGWPGREYYGATTVDLRQELKDRPHLNPFKDEAPFVTFRKKGATT